MADLHEALKFLLPVEWTDIPSQSEELSKYLDDLFSKAQLIVESVPLPGPEDSHAAQAPQEQVPGQAKKGSDVTLSAARPESSGYGHEEYGKSWGKPQKLKASENPLGISLYKMSGKDSRGSWFARRSIHEGIGFSKFKHSLQMEFEKSLAVQGKPGAGNIRGIGGEEMIERREVEGKGAVEVFRLSAQFPGPTAPRDFVTMLATSDRALKNKQGPAPRHWMVISRPCNHPKTQPTSQFVRGFYESVEFIREVSRNGSISENADGLNEVQDENPVEWIMVTRSDPGGGIPRFLVERGTPSSIAGDALKFMDWAVTNDQELQGMPTQQKTAIRPTTSRTESHKSWRGKATVGVREAENAHQTEPSQSTAESIRSVPEPTQNLPAVRQTDPDALSVQSAPAQTIGENQQAGIFGTIAGAVGGVAAMAKPYTPQAILNHLPVATQSETSLPQTKEQPESGHAQLQPSLLPQTDAETASLRSTSSFHSASDGIPDSERSLERQPSSPSVHTSTSPRSLIIPLDPSHPTSQEKEVLKLDAKRSLLVEKHKATQSRLDAEKASRDAADSEMSLKEREKHDREMLQHEQKYQKELRKLEEKQEKERRKLVEKRRKEVEKDEKVKLARERDEAREEVELLKKETASLRGLVQDLQMENTALTVRLGRAGIETAPTGRVSRSSSSASKRERRAMTSSASAKS